MITTGMTYSWSPILCVTSLGCSVASLRHPYAIPKVEKRGNLIIWVVMPWTYFTRRTLTGNVSLRRKWQNFGGSVLVGWRGILGFGSPLYLWFISLFNIRFIEYRVVRTSSYVYVRLISHMPALAAYTYYSFFEWSLIILDVFYDSVLASDLRAANLQVSTTTDLYQTIS